MCQQRGPTDGCQQRKHFGRPGVVPTAEPHPPFEQSKRHGEEDEEAVLQHLDVTQTLEEALIPHRPDLGVRPQEQEHRQPHEHQRPMSRPAHAPLIEQSQQTDQRDEHACPVMIELRPRNIRRIADRQEASARHESVVGVVSVLSGGFGIELGLQSRQCQHVVLRRDHARPDRRVAFHHFVPRHPVSDQIDRGGHRGERGGGEKDGKADADFNFGKPFHARHRHVRAGFQSLDRAKIAVAEGEQHDEHRNLRHRHHAIGSAVKRIGRGNIIECERRR